MKLKEKEFLAMSKKVDSILGPWSLKILPWLKFGSSSDSILASFAVRLASEGSLLDSECILLLFSVLSQTGQVCGSPSVHFELLLISRILVPQLFSGTFHSFWSSISKKYISWIKSKINWSLIKSNLGSIARSTNNSIYLTFGFT